MEKKEIEKIWDNNPRIKDIETINKMMQEAYDLGYNDRGMDE